MNGQGVRPKWSETDEVPNAWSKTETLDEFIKLNSVRDITKTEDKSII